MSRKKESPPEPLISLPGEEPERLKPGEKRPHMRIPEEMVTRTPARAPRRRARAGPGLVSNIRLQDLRDTTVSLTGAARIVRSTLIRQLSNVGCNVVETVTINTDYVLCRDLNTNTQKARDARRHNIPIVPYSNFGW